MNLMGSTRPPPSQNDTSWDRRSKRGCRWAWPWSSTLFTARSDTTSVTRLAVPAARSRSAPVLGSFPSSRSTDFPRAGCIHLPASVTIPGLSKGLTLPPDRTIHSVTVCGFRRIRFRRRASTNLTGAAVRALDAAAPESDRAGRQLHHSLNAERGLRTARRDVAMNDYSASLRLAAPATAMSVWTKSLPLQRRGSPSVAASAQEKAIRLPCLIF